MAVLDKHKVSLTVKWLTRVASLPIIAPGRSVMVPEVTGYGKGVSVPSPDEDTWENNTIKRALQYVRWLKTLKLAGAMLTYVHMSSPHWRQRHQPHSDYTKETGIASSIRLRGVVMARNWKGHTYCDVTTIRQTRHFRFWRRQISRWRRRWFRAYSICSPRSPRTRRMRRREKE